MPSLAQLLSSLLPADTGALVREDREEKIMTKDRKALDQRLYAQTSVEPGRKQASQARSARHAKDLAELGAQRQTPYVGGPAGKSSRGWSGGVMSEAPDVVAKPLPSDPRTNSNKTLENKSANRIALAEELASLMAQSDDPGLVAHATAFLKAKGQGRHTAARTLIEAYNQSPLAMSRVAQ
jgi:hypothetical protein